MEKIYVRGSNDQVNTANQLVDLRQHSPEGQLYEDNDSGSKANRPALERLIAECEAGDTVWIWSLDRLTREGVLATLQYIKRLSAKQVRVLSVRESWLDTSSPCYEIMVSCMAFAAKLERDRLIERTKTGIARSRQERGKPLLDKVAIRAAEGTLRQIAKRFGCSAPYVLRCRRG